MDVLYLSSSPGKEDERKGEEKVNKFDNDILFELIKRTQDYPKLKVSVDGVLLRIAEKKGNISNDLRFMAKEIARLYSLGREAWLKGDLETVADMFGVLSE